MPYRLVATSGPGKPRNLQAKQGLFLRPLQRAPADCGIFPTWLLPTTFRNLISTLLSGLRAKRFLTFFHLYKAYAFISLCFKTSTRKAESGSNKLSSLSYVLFFLLSTCQTTTALLLTPAGAA